MDLTYMGLDNVYCGSENEQLYITSVAPLVKSAMDGLNATVFAYGQTSSGKTYTMMGAGENPGVIPLAVEDVFDYIAETSEQREFLLRVSYMEIYNETIRDLLAPDNFDLKIHQDKNRGIIVLPLKEEVVSSPDHVMNIIRKGETNRHISSTDYNERSSRSHTIFQFIVESRERLPGSPAMTSVNRHRTGAKVPTIPVRLSCLNLIDLAGSEKASASADRRREGAFINKSLLTLGTVISKLTEENAGHIPYRDSKLTRILQHSLSGNARVSVICTVSPALSNQEESTNTLKFAQRIKNVTTRAKTTEIVADHALLQKYRNEIEELRLQLTEVSGRSTEHTQLAAEKQRLEEELQQQQLVRTALKERIDQLTKLILTSSSFNSTGIMSGLAGKKEDETKTQRRAHRLSYVPPSPDSPAEVPRLQKEVAALQALCDTQKAEIMNMRNAVAEKSGQIVDLEYEIARLKSQIPQPGSQMQPSQSNDLIFSLRS
eukprot:Partr_v1_DN28541_c2_g1_i1_m73746 putative Kinesin family